MKCINIFKIFINSLQINNDDLLISNNRLGTSEGNSELIAQDSD